MAFKRDSKVKNNFSAMRIRLASPEEIKENSYGPVLKAETINYRSLKPEKDGLFCERIFGPVKDYECHCGKYKRVRYRGIVCDKCGVEVTEKKVRRERMGHIDLATPVTHIWYSRSQPNKIAYLLGIPAKKLEEVIYYNSYVVVQAGIYRDQLNDPKDFILDIQKGDELIRTIPFENVSLPESDPDKVIIKTGAEAIYDLLCRVDLDSLSYELRVKTKSKSQTQRKDAFQRLQVVESFRASNGLSRPEWMVMKVIPVIPPELRPLVPLDGGRYAASDLNELYRRLILRNNRLRKIIEQNAPEIIVRQSKRLLQEAVDSLFDNSNKASATKGENNRVYKSLTDNLKGKQGRFRQNLLGKRVDFSARSVIVVGPELKMHECGLPKHMAAELYKPFIINKLIDRGLAKTVKAARRLVDRKEAIIWEILEHVIKGHPVLLNRAPTLHRLGIQAFQPKLIEGKAIQLHPLACTAFNADFDGDQMAVHLPLSHEAILEAQMLMLGSQNILNPASGEPITAPSQDMILGLYYISKEDLRLATGDKKMTFYGIEEANIAYNERKIKIHQPIRVLLNGVLKDTTMGRLIFYKLVPEEINFDDINKVLTKNELKRIISEVVGRCGISRTSQFLDDIKNLGFYMAFKGGLSFSLKDVIVPEQKWDIIEDARKIVAEANALGREGFLGETERYQKVTSTWKDATKKISDLLVEEIEKDKGGFNSIYMMMHSGARGSKEQIAQLGGMKGLMAKPQKSNVADAQSTLENPILANFKEGIPVQEYFISTHGSRKGLSDTALKTADAGYLTRRLVDVSQDVFITEEDCGTLRGLTVSELKENGAVVASLYQRILGRVALNDVLDPSTGQPIVCSGEMIDESAAKRIEESGIAEVEIRSVLTCESTKGVCAKCYGRDLARRTLVQIGEVVGIIAAQAIGEPGTQLTLRTFHAGGVASTKQEETTGKASVRGIIKFDDNIKLITPQGKDYTLLTGREVPLYILHPETQLAQAQIELPRTAKLFVKEGDLVEVGQVLYEFDPLHTPIYAEADGRLEYVDLEPEVTYEVKGKERMIIESRSKDKAPKFRIVDASGAELWHKELSVGTSIDMDNGVEVKLGDVLGKRPRTAIKSAGDITGGLPRVTELVEARNPSKTAVMTEINGIVTIGKVQRSNRVVYVTSDISAELNDKGEWVKMERKYLIPLNQQLLVESGDYVKAGDLLCDGPESPLDILTILGPKKVQEYIVNGVQSVYRAQGVNINDKHFEIIVRQMMRMVEIANSGDTNFLDGQVVDKLDVLEANDALWGKMLVVDAGDSELFKAGQIVEERMLLEENRALRRKGLRPVEAERARPATTKQILQGITKAALSTKSFLSAASFQETPKVLNNAAIEAKLDRLEALKENVICGRLIPAGTGQRRFERLEVLNKTDLIRTRAARIIPEMPEGD